MENSNSTTTFNLFGSTTETATMNFMTEDVYHLSTNEVGDTIEVVYKTVPTVSYTSGYSNFSINIQVFKIIYSWENGKMKKSDRIYGRFVPKQDEYYEFD